MNAQELPAVLVSIARFWLKNGDYALSLDANYDGPPARSFPEFVLVSAPIYVSEDFARLVDAAGKSYPRLPLDRDEVGEFTDGFAWFEHALTIPFNRFNEQHEVVEHVPVEVRAFQWNRIRFGVGAPETRGVQLIAYSDPDAHANFTMMPGARWVVLPYSPGVYPLGEVPTEDFMYARTLWALLRQRVAVRTHVHLSRAQHRRALRDGVVPDVQVITLRRARTHTEATQEQSVDWSHRWIVGGHWRSQWLPSARRHEPRWIAPYIKGPPDKPLVTVRAFNLVR